MSQSSAVVVKVGGSLYDLPDLGQRLSRWLTSQMGGVLIVPGGGAMVESIRRLDRIHRLGEEACHWLALRTLSVNAHFLAHLLPGAPIIADPKQRTTSVAIVDMFPFALADEASPGRLPHCWEATSDSLAVRVAIAAGAGKLVLLKSADVPAGSRWQDWPPDMVDRHFHQAMTHAPSDLQIEAVNFRTWNGNSADRAADTAQQPQSR